MDVGETRLTMHVEMGMFKAPARMDGGVHMKNIIIIMTRSLFGKTELYT